MNSFDVARLKKHKTFVTVVLVAITCVVLFGGSFWTIVSAGNTGVQSRFGKVYDEELSSGFI